MSLLSVPDEHFLTFLGALFANPNGSSWQVDVREDAATVSVDDPLIEQMIGRAIAGLPFALPHAGTSVDRWIVTGGDRNSLDQAILRIERALVPSFARFPSEGGVAIPSAFSADKSTLHRAGAERFPHGYYSFISPPAYRRQVRDRLAHWVRLEAEQPPVRELVVPTYADLVARFHAATAASQWGDAERALVDLDRFNLCSADNFRFLQIELLARQGRWSELWEAPDRGRIVALRIPRAVRAALLVAFHTTVLAPVEAVHGVMKALERYGDERGGLHELLTGRYGLDHPSVLIVYGYEAAYSADRATLGELEAGAPEPARAVLRALAASLPSEQEAPALPSAEARLRRALLVGDFDAALVHADELEDPPRRLIARVEIAARSADGPLCSEVLQEFWDRSTEDRARLLASSSALEASLALVTHAAGKDAVSKAVVPPAARWAVGDWSEWFGVALAFPDDKEAYAALERIEGCLERCFSDPWAAELADRIVAVAVNDAMRTRPLFKDAIQRLAHELVADTRFPRTGFGADELHEATFLALADSSERNADQSLVLLALVEALLSRNPARMSTLAAPVLDWFSHPYPAMEQRALDATELLVDYGVSPDGVATHARRWVEEMLDRPTQWNSIRIAVWQELVRWSHAGADLDHRLAQRLTTVSVEADEDPVASLRAGFHIAIFTLRPGSAERAKTLLLERNKALRVSICGATTLTDQAKELARTADLPVIVTRCITHALTEGIRPYLTQDPVYPPASGSTGILEKVVEAAGAVSMA